MIKFFFSGILIVCLLQFEVMAQQNPEVVPTGAMRDAMWKGELEGKIALDTLPQENLYGLGPIEFLAGELMILDGIVVTSRISEDSSIAVGIEPSAKAPFFVHAYVKNWEEHQLPDTIQTISDLDQYLLEIQKSQSPDQPFPFRLVGLVQSANFHIVNLPEGTKVSSPTEAHQDMRHFTLQDEVVEILGFFSTKHQTVFTHHDTFTHMHLITSDKRQMGHLDKVILHTEHMKLYLPEK